MNKNIINYIIGLEYSKFILTENYKQTNDQHINNILQQLNNINILNIFNDNNLNIDNLNNILKEFSFLSKGYTTFLKVSQNTLYENVMEGFSQIYIENQINYPTTKNNTLNILKQMLKKRNK